MALRRYVSAKIHGIRCVEKSVEYQGSVTVSKNFLDFVGMQEYEMVHVVNLTNGKRWQTYLLAETIQQHYFSLNGGGARLGEVEDSFVLFTEVLAEEFLGARVLELDEGNNMNEVFSYGSYSIVKDRVGT